MNSYNKFVYISWLYALRFKLETYFYESDRVIVRLAPFISKPTFDISNITETTEYPWKTSLIYRPKENSKFKFFEKPPINAWGFLLFSS